ncbi:UbiA prenyltransferase family-domain-containing protein [Aspergillus cavernicola]|uniref:UbiA prenyltransferase family-domain-containing protein n=1 Tax=Aspergillus cavernicola TaxID=176166 RepID=A0ABR4ITB5_9EURO
MSKREPKATSVTPDKHLGWIIYLPTPLIPYAELARINILFAIPLATYQTILGVLYALAILPPTPSSPQILLASSALCLASYLCHCAGCVWNDTVDQDLDRQTTRCKNRPVARGEISTPSATLYALSLIYLAYTPLAHFGLPFSSTCLRYAAAVALLTAGYPFTKRLTNYPQLWLGAGYACAFLTAAQGILDLYQNPGSTPGYTHTYPRTNPQPKTELFSSPHVTFSTTSLSAAILLLQSFFDILYALSDTEDDLRSGVGSMAVRYRFAIPQVLGVLLGLIIACLGVSGWSAGFRGVYFGLGVCGVWASLGGKVLGLMRVKLGIGRMGMGKEERGGWNIPVAVGCLMGGLGWEGTGRG